MLDPVLAKHPSDEWGVVTKMKKELEHMRRVIGALKPEDKRD
jgi:hypothetical protein